MHTPTRTAQVDIRLVTSAGVVAFERTWKVCSERPPGFPRCDFIARFVGVKCSVPRVFLCEIETITRVVAEHTRVPLGCGIEMQLVGFRGIPVPTPSCCGSTYSPLRQSVGGLGSPKETKVKITLDLSPESAPATFEITIGTTVLLGKLRYQGLITRRDRAAPTLNLPGSPDINKHRRTLSSGAYVASHFSPSYQVMLVLYLALLSCAFFPH